MLNCIQSGMILNNRSTSAPCRTAPTTGSSERSLWSPTLRERWTVSTRGIAIIAGLLLLSACSSFVRAGTCPTNQVTKLVDQIYIIEGAEKAIVPYGIKALQSEWLAAGPEKRPAVKAKCRRWCFNTVRNNIVRWVNDGSSGCYLDYLADRYCPSKTDPEGNRNWKRNIKARMGHTSCQR